MNGQNVEFVGEFNYLGMALKSSRGWKKQQTSPKTKGREAFVALEKRVSVTPSIKGIDEEFIFI